MLHAEDSVVGPAESQPAGTPRHMAPEQMEAGTTDHRADIYSLGVALYELLTGELPADRLEPPSSKVQIDVRLDEIVLRALSVSPSLRFQSATQFSAQLQTVASSPPRRGERGAASAPAGSGRLIKAGSGILTTPEKLATASGQLLCFQTRGQLILDDRQLTHSRDGVDTVIPLAAIRDLSPGKLPRSVNPAGLNLISVTYEEDGRQTDSILLGLRGRCRRRSGHFHLGRRGPALIAPLGQPPATARGVRLPPRISDWHHCKRRIGLARAAADCLLEHEARAGGDQQFRERPGANARGLNAWTAIDRQEQRFQGRSRAGIAKSRRRFIGQGDGLRK